MAKLINYLKYSAATVLGLGLAAGSAQAITLTPTNDGNALVNTILGSGITVSNINYTGASGASGFFTGGLASGLGIDSGILLTSGQAINALGPNNSSNTTGNNGFAGDADLDALIPESTNDATVLEFDFVSNGGDVFFNYVFGSEEYPEWVGSSYNDVFAFFLNGENIALVPDTTTPVSINNVNSGSYSQFYNDNTGGLFNIQYDGFTNVLTAKALGLSAGTHRIKLAIADAGDFAYDSGVFIQAGTFSDTYTPPKVPEPASLLGLLGIAALGANSVLKRKQNQDA